MGGFVALTLPITPHLKINLNLRGSFPTLSAAASLFVEVLLVGLGHLLNLIPEPQIQKPIIAIVVAFWQGIWMELLPHTPLRAPPLLQDAVLLPALHLIPRVIP